MFVHVVHATAAALAVILYSPIVRFSSKADELQVLRARDD